jgi:hypothetical protein
MLLNSHGSITHLLVTRVWKIFQDICVILASTTAICSLKKKFAQCSCYQLLIWESNFIQVINDMKYSHVHLMMEKEVNVHVKRWWACHALCAPTSFVYFKQSLDCLKTRENGSELQLCPKLMIHVKDVGKNGWAQIMGTAVEFAISKSS